MLPRERPRAATGHTPRRRSVRPQPSSNPVCIPKPRAATSIKTTRTDGISQYYFSQKRAHGRYRPQKPDKADYLFQLYGMVTEEYSTMIFDFRLVLLCVW